MQNLGAAVRHPPGPRDTAREHRTCGRASPSEYWDHRQPNMAERGPLPVTRLHFVSRAAFAATAAALGHDIARRPAADAELGPDGGFGRDAAPGSGHASSARPQGHCLGTAGQWARAPQRVRRQSADYYGRTLAFFGEPALLAPRPHRPMKLSAFYISSMYYYALYTQKYIYTNIAWGFGVLG